MVLMRQLLIHYGNGFCPLLGVQLLLETTRFKLHLNIVHDFTNINGMAPPQNEIYQQNKNKDATKGCL